MRILGYEFKKFWSQRAIVLFLVVLMGANSVSIVVRHNLAQQTSSQSAVIEASINAETAAMEVSEKADYFASQVLRYSEFQAYQAYQISVLNIGSGTKLPIFDDPQFILDFQNYVMDQDHDLRQTVYQQKDAYYQKLVGYSDYLNSVIAGIDGIQASGSFRNAQTWKKENLEVMARRYQALQGTVLQETTSMAIDEMVADPLTDLLVLAAVLVITLAVFQSDDDNQMHEMMLLNKYGRAWSLLAKLVVLFLLLGSFVLVLEVSTKLTYMLVAGRINGSVAMQSTLALYESPYRWSINQWFMNYIALKIAASWALALVMSFLYQCFRQKWLAVSLFLGLFILSVLINATISENSAQAILRYVNLATWLNLGSLLSHFQMLGLWSHAVYAVDFVRVAALVVSLVLLPILFWRFRSLHRPHSSKLALPTLLSGWLYRSTSIFRHESNKLWLMNRGLLVVLVVLGLQINNATKFSSISANERSFKTEVQVVTRYYGGYLTNARRAQILSKQEEYDQLDLYLNSQQAAYIRGELSYDAYQEQIGDYVQASQERGLFNIVMATYHDDGDYLIYPNGYQAIFSTDTDERDVRSALMAVVLIVILVSSIYTTDQANHEDDLYQLSRYGRNRRRNRKWLLGLIVVLGTALISFGFDWFSFQHYYGMNAWVAPYSSIVAGLTMPVMAFPFNAQMPLWAYGLGLWLIRLLALSFTVILTIFISSRQKKTVNVILMIACVIFIPFILDQAGLSWAQDFSVLNYIMGNRAILSGHLLIFLPIMAVLSIVMVLNLNHRINDASKR